MTVNTNDLRDAVVIWASQGARAALDELRRTTRDAAPYGASEEGRDGRHLVDTEEARVISDGGEIWEGTLAYTADHASYLDTGTGPHQITGNPLLSFLWGGQRIIVHSVQHPGSHVWDGWFSQTVTDETWADVVIQNLGDLN